MANQSSQVYVKCVIAAVFGIRMIRADAEREK